MRQLNALEKEFLEKLNNNKQIITKICFVYCRNGTDKDDLFQEIILQLWKSYPGFRGEAAFSTWMYRIALNTAISMTRKPAFLYTLDKAPAASYDLEKDYGYNEEIKLLYRAIGRLNKIEKAIILLWLEENSYLEIATIVGLSEKNISVKLVRIKAKLSELISKMQ